MDLQVSEKSSVGTFRKTQKRHRRSHDQEMSQIPGTSGASKTVRKGDGTNARKECAPPTKRGKICGRRHTGQFYDANEQGKLWSIVTASKNAVSTADDKNSSNIGVGSVMQHESTCTHKRSHRKRKRLPSHERNSSMDLPAASPRGRNELSGNVSEGLAFMTTEQESASRNPDSEAPEGRPSFSRQDAHSEGRESRTSRAALHVPSNRLRFSLQCSFNIEPAALEGESRSTVFAIIHALTESFSSLSGTYENIGSSVRISLNSDAGPNSHGLSTAQINRLPTRFFSETCTSGHEEAFHAIECQICLCVYKERVMLRTLPCLHEFHSSCVDKWLKINRSCPVCRALIAIGPGDQ